MSQQLISRSPDLVRLRNAGYAISVVGSYLVVADVPYVDSNKEVRRGLLVSELTLAGDMTTRPSTHVVFFAGEHPCDRSGQPLQQIVNSSNRRDLGHGLVVDHTFSSKPTGGYADYEHKLATYAALVGGPAVAIDPNATARTFPVSPTDDAACPFMYLDTASGRAGIEAMNSCFQGQRVGVLGLGGTGAYIADLVSKTPVDELHFWDGDHMHQHNAFRAPGAVTVATLEAAPNKSDYYATVYSSIHRRVVSHPDFVDESNLDEVCEMDFVFVAVGDGEAKAAILDRLLVDEVPFIDVGIGVYEVDGALAGSLRVTTATAQHSGHIEHRIPLSAGGQADRYSTNIQIADLNALNASLAVLRWKRLLGFYNDLASEHHAIYDIDGNSLTIADQP